jgi:diguanylate cyclase (GGDEF)-like protein
MALQGGRKGCNAEALARTTEEPQRQPEPRTEQDPDQTAADLDHAQADSDQMAALAHQPGSDADKTLADSDHDASHPDQLAVDSERSGASESRVAQVHEASRLEQNATSREGDSTAAARSHMIRRGLATATRRDEISRARDLAAAARDRTAQARDEAADACDRAAERRERRTVAPGHLDALAPLRALRASEASVRRQAALERVAAADDREAAAADRQQAGVDRVQAGLDELTGVFRRGTGEMSLTQEIARSRRSGQPLILALIDVDALKAVNDEQGHAAGDALLRDVTTAITSTMRSYDITVRWGGDEFVCALSKTTLEVAANRVAAIQRALEARRPGASISVGLAELADDTLDSLLARADTALYHAKFEREV